MSVLKTCLIISAANGIRSIGKTACPAPAPSWMKTAAGRQGFNAWMNPEIIAAEPDMLVLEIEVRPEMTQHHGFVHGGCVSAFADTAAAWLAALATLKDVVTANYAIQLVAPANGARLKAEARLIKAGRSSVTVSVDVSSKQDTGEEKICATVLSSIAIVSG